MTGEAKSQTSMKVLVWDFFVQYHCGEGEGSPHAFYKRLGFTPNGDTF
ncbi:hypothetical protein BRE01_21880 [Brevibacillus reuszeri]|uniref:Acetyltransferase n=1 Tax=Brevibacillus reuszeri TaxID=54915 RepID=A0ABQ0TKT0_9BACL|nr:hypothetical protein BRE01_21880 [Brevibacillus reuszeri]